MKLFLDTEFNGFGGELISLALVAEDGSEWYGVLQIPSQINAWVKEHVIPYLAIEACDGKPLGITAFVDSFERFIVKYPNAEIIADWPADLEWLCHMLTYAGHNAGFSIPIECTMRLTRVGGIKPEIPHNALSDARALKEAYLKNERRNAYIATQMVELGDSVPTPNRAIYPLAI